MPAGGPEISVLVSNIPACFRKIKLPVTFMGGTMKRLNVSLCLLLSGMMFQGFALPSDSCQPGSTKMSDNGTMAFRLYIPRNFSTQYRYPLVMCLHGIGECGTDGRIQIDREYMDHQWMLDSVKSKYKPFVLYPQCPSSSYEWGYFNTGTAAQKGYAALPAQAAVKVIDSLIKVYPIDTTRLYVGGLSWGGIGTEGIMMSYPNKFAAAFPTAGENYLNTVSVMIKTPFWIFHGLADGTVPVRLDTQLVSACIAAGTPVVKFYSSLGTAVPFAISNVTGIVSLDSLGRAVAGGSKYLGHFINGGDHGSGWHAAFYNNLLVPWLMSKSKVNGLTVFTWPAPGPKAVTAVAPLPAAAASVNAGVLQIAGRTVRWNGVSQLPARIDIYSANGTLVMRHDITRQSGKLDCSELAKGVYAVEIVVRDWSERKMMTFY
jgi:predicted esterase